MRGDGSGVERDEAVDVEDAEDDDDVAWSVKVESMKEGERARRKSAGEEGERASGGT